MKSKYKLPSKNSMKRRSYTLFFKTFYTYDEKGSLKESFNVMFDIRRFKVAKIIFLFPSENIGYMLPTVKDFMSRRYSRRVPRRFDLVSNHLDPRIFDVVDLDNS